jgi:hypothetical protein
MHDKPNKKGHTLGMGDMNDDFWNELYRDVPIEIQEGEKTLRMMIEEIDRGMTHDTMKAQVKRWIKEGKIVSVGFRIVGGKLAQAYKAVNPHN